MSLIDIISLMLLTVGLMLLVIKMVRGCAMNDNCENCKYHEPTQWVGYHVCTNKNSENYGFMTADNESCTKHEEVYKCNL